MYSSAEVLEMMDTLPVGERLFVVEETLRKIRTADTTALKAEVSVEQVENTPSEKMVKPYKHPFLSMVGTWNDADAAEFNKIIEEGDKIDYDEW